MHGDVPLCVRHACAAITLNGSAPAARVKRAHPEGTSRRARRAAPRPSHDTGSPFSHGPCSLPPSLAGYLLGSFSMDPASQAGSNPQVSAQLAALQKGGPWGQARNLGVFTGANAGLSLAIKKARGGKEDVWGS